ncbi:hypothetical protein [Nitrosovibrio tenuis]|uniref:UrcA family protein n=1 Tax=Nitrosovibrio tenuis TaxID=1233 RepID=A0A1H7LMS1_9PROT|nr:hypothetical protein [Nitrosovibrio tenuis]SEL00302.1 hypothetical protein SAMN05216387_104112 [Nitrosovibrio tenuis]
MTIMKTVLAAISIVAMFSMMPPAFAQHPGLVSVDIRNVADNIAKNINVDVSQVPAMVEVKANVAAHVCEVAESVLAAHQKSASASCIAKITSPALDLIVEQQVKGITKPRP